MSYREHFVFSTITLELIIFHVLQCVFLIFHDFQSSRHIPGPTNCVCLFFNIIFSLLAICQVLHCAFFIFHVFQYFSPYARSNSVFCLIFHVFSVFSPFSSFYSVHFSFSTFFRVFAIFHLPHCVFLLFHDFQVTRHIQGPTVCISHFPCF